MARRGGRVGTTILTCPFSGTSCLVFLGTGGGQGGTGLLSCLSLGGEGTLRWDWLGSPTYLPDMERRVEGQEAGIPYLPELGDWEHGRFGVGWGHWTWGGEGTSTVVLTCVTIKLGRNCKMCSEGASLWSIDTRCQSFPDDSDVGDLGLNRFLWSLRHLQNCHSTCQRADVKLFLDTVSKDPGVSLWCTGQRACF